MTARKPHILFERGQWHLAYGQRDITQREYWTELLPATAFVAHLNATE